MEADRPSRDFTISRSPGLSISRPPELPISRLCEAAVHRHAVRDHRFNFSLGAADLAQNLDAVLAQLGCRVPLAAHAGGPLVGQPHAARLAFSGVVLQLEETDVLQVRV